MFVMDLHLAEREDPFSGGATDAGSCLDRFREGTRPSMTACYMDYFETVDRAIGRVLHGPDRETVVHEVFFRIMADADLRRSFQGGSFRAWISTIARNHAIDHWRRQQRELVVDGETFSDGEGEADCMSSQVEARILIQRFCDELLPAKWQRVFEVRFLRQLDQSSAARELGISRTTLIYQEQRVRRLLRRFLLREETP